MVRPNRALVVINAYSRRGNEDVSTALDVLRSSGMEVLALRLTNSADVEAAIREHRALVDLIVVGGGDGTMNAAAEALAASNLPVGILPLGTANDLARVLEIPNDPAEAAKIILAGHKRRIDLGCANDKLFFNIATMGLSARLARAMDPQTKRRFGALAYGLTLLRIGLGHPFRATISTMEGTVEVKAIQIAVGNGRYHGGGVIVHEAAAIDDQLLHLYALEPQSTWQLVRKLPWLLRGKHETTAGVITVTAPAMEVVTDRMLSVNTDGELTTQTPVQFRVVPEALEVYAPAGIGAS